MTTSAETLGQSQSRTEMDEIVNDGVGWTIRGELLAVVPIDLQRSSCWTGGTEAKRPVAYICHISQFGCVVRHRSK